MRTCAVVFVLAAGLTASVAQSTSTASAQQALDKCTSELATLQAKLDTATNEGELVFNSATVLLGAAGEAERAGNIDRAFEMEQAANRQLARYDKLGRDATVLTVDVKFKKEECEKLALSAPPFVPITPRPPEPRRVAGGNLGGTPFAWRFSAVADLGRPFTSSPERRFDAFSQTLEEGANNGWYGSLGVQADTPAIFDGPLARVWFTAAATMFYLNTKLQRVTNDGGGQVSSSGDDLLRGVALLAGFGGRLWPNDPVLSRWEWQLLGGLGYALNSIRGVGPAGGEQFSGSEHVTPWLARFALYYSITDNLKAGLALSLITTPEITGRLPSGTQFQIGRVTNYIAAISMVYSFYTSSQGRYLPSLQ